MQRILVTGGAGFIGSSVIDSLLSETKAMIACIDNFDDAYNKKYKQDNIHKFLSSNKFSLFEIDIRDKDKLMSVFSEVKPTHVLHLAAKADTRKAVVAPHSYIETNIIGTLNIFEAAVAYGVQQVVAASSSSVYGNNSEVPWSELNQDLHPISPYGVTKLSTEHLAYTYYKNHHLPITMLRYFNAYGERNRPDMVPYIWAKAILSNQSVFISGDGSRCRDYTYIGDIVRGTVAALQTPLEFEVLNLGHGSPLSLNELLSIFERVTGKKIIAHSRPSHSASVEETYADISKVNKLLDWKPEISHEEGISRLISWFSSHRLEK